MDAMNSLDALLQSWPNPTKEMLASPQFEAIWRCIKSWDINVPIAHNGYCGATGKHVRAILDALATIPASPLAEEELVRRFSDIVVAQNLEPATDEELRKWRYVVMSKLLDSDMGSAGAFLLSKILKRLERAEAARATDTALIREMHDALVFIRSATGEQIHTAWEYVGEAIRKAEERLGETS